MWYIALVLFAGIGLIFGIFNWFGKKQSSNIPTQKNQEVDHRLRPVIPPDSIHGKYSRDEIQKKLIKLSKSPKPLGLNPGAMCYDMAGPPPRAEYVCPVCGEKTLYTDDNTFFITYELISCRSMAEGLKGLDLKLDESAFCKKCHPEISEPDLCIEIMYEGEKKPYRCCSVSVDDLELLGDFLSGRKIHKGSTDDEYPLSDFVGRLEVLLGVKIEKD